MNTITKTNLGLEERVINSGTWMVGISIFSKGLQLLSLIILARLLTPNDFGLFGIALLSLSILEAFSVTGFEEFLVHKKNKIENYLDTAWVLLILRSLGIFLILYFLAPYIALFFNTPAASGIIKVLGASVFLKSFQNIGIIYFKKNLKFKKRFVYEIGGSLTYFIISVILAFYWKNVWALVIGVLAQYLTMLILSYILHPYKPSLKFKFSIAQEMFNYGKWVLGSNISIFLGTHGDDIIVGKILGTTFLGLYQISYKISNITATEITHVISQVAFPTYSIMQDEKYKLKKGFLKTFKFISLFVFPLTVIIFTVIPEFTLIILGQKWEEIIWPTRILAFSGLIRAIVATGGPLFQSIGKPNFDFKMNLYRLLFILITIYPFIIKWKLLGACFSVLLGTLSTIPYWYKKSSQVTNSSFKDYYASFYIPLTSSILMFLTMLFLKEIIKNDILSLILLPLIGTLVYTISICLLDIKYKNNILNDLKKILNLILKRI